MSRTHSPGELSPGAANTVRQNARAVAALPEPSETWLFRDVDIGHDKLRQFAQTGIIEVEERTPSADPHVWRTDSAAYAAATETLEAAEQLPCCGATGVTNDGGDLKCIGCDATIDPDVYRELDL